ncbi:hypothetical protein SUNI508_13052 [Seiridium unicorne]|uniref:Fungal specific transcription factor n=1 Tax=Seiridium unicorne TaxID=138068 RepID=A0ABR2VEN3_9PEZI
MGLQDSRWSSGRTTTSTLRSWPRSVPSISHPQPEQSSIPAPTQSVAYSTVTHPARISPERELDRYLKLVARLKWKLPFLAEGYRIATDRIGRNFEDVSANEIHFKIDFYEYYMHIERALVHLMAVFGIKITGLGDSLHSPSNGYGKAQDRGIRMGVAQSTHRFHANVLAALDKPDNPLHQVLGQGEVKKQLARAKDLRNRWKNADGDSGSGEKGFTPAPLEAYNLEKILETIFAGFDQGHALAELYIQKLRGNEVAGHANAMDWDREEEEWSFIADAMDWEAI